MLPSNTDDITMLMDSFGMQQQQQQQMTEPSHLTNDNLGLSPGHQMTQLASPSNTVNNTPPRLSHMNAQNFPVAPNQIPGFSVPHPPATPRQQQIAQQQQKNPSAAHQQNNNYDFTLQWTNEHFGGEQNDQVMVPDSTGGIENDFESMMVNGIASLNTQQQPPQSRPKTNMAINRMDSLINSYAEENKYFEFNSERYH